MNSNLVEAPSTSEEGAAASAPRRTWRRLPVARSEVNRSWELELLISGAVLFALLQLPAQVDAAYQSLAPHLARQLGMALMFGYWYVKAILYALIAFFIVHLSARAYWIGLLGLDSAFPHGVRWEKLRHGPITTQVYQESLSPLPALAERTHRFCSVVFSFAFVIVIMMGLSIVAAAFLGGIAYGISRALLGGEHFGLLFYGLSALVLLSSSLALGVDKALAGRLDPDTRRGRLVRRGVHAYVTLLGLRLYGPILMTLFSNIRKRFIYPVFYVAFFGLLVLVAVEFLAREELLWVNSRDYLPEAPGAHSVDARYYENQRASDQAYLLIPSIQADIVAEPFLKLFIPYSPDRHNRALADLCPGLAPLQERGVRLSRRDASAAPDDGSAAVLRCMADLHQVSFNGERRPDVEFHFYTHPRTDLPGVIAYIPTEGLPRGRNLLTLQPVPRARSAAPQADAKPPEPHRIPFWL